MSFVSRLSSAWKAARGEVVFPSYPGETGPWDIEHAIARALNVAVQRFQGTNIDWVKEADDLSLSALVMPFVNWLGGVMPQAPFHVVQEDADGKFQPIADHPLPKLIKKPNPFFSSQQYWSTFSLSHLISGNWYQIKQYNAMGIPIRLWWVPPRLMTPVWPSGPATSLITRYDYHVQGTFIPYPVEDDGSCQVMHWRHTPDHRTLGRTGVSPFLAAMREIVGDSEWSNYEALLAKGSGVPPFLLSPKTGVNAVALDDKEIKRVQERFDAARTQDRRGKSMFVHVGMDATKLGQNPKDLMLNELRYAGQEIVSSLIGIPAEVANFGCAARYSSYNNIKEAHSRAYEDVVTPLYTSLQEFYDSQLLPDFYPNRIVPQGVRCHFDISEIRALQEDENEFSTRVCRQYSTGIIKRKEAKDKLNYAFDDDEDDVYYTDLVPTRITERISLDGLTPEQIEATRDALELEKPTSANASMAKRRQLARGKPNGDESKSLPSGTPSHAELAAMERGWIANAPKGAKDLYKKGNRNGHGG